MPTYHVQLQLEDEWGKHIRMWQKRTKMWAAVKSWEISNIWRLWATRTLSVPLITDCYGMTYKDISLFVTVQMSGILHLDLTTNSVEAILEI